MKNRCAYDSRKQKKWKGSTLVQSAVVVNFVLEIDLEDGKCAGIADRGIADVNYIATSLVSNKLEVSVTRLNLSLLSQDLNGSHSHSNRMPSTNSIARVPQVLKKIRVLASYDRIHSLLVELCNAFVYLGIRGIHIASSQVESTSLPNIGWLWVVREIVCILEASSPVTEIGGYDED